MGSIRLSSRSGRSAPNRASCPLLWSDLITANPALGATEEWEIYNFTEDAHPIHVHLVNFKVLGRGDGTRPPEDWEGGFTDTVIAYPGEITCSKANYDLPGFFVMLCHIVEHEDNEMMRPYHIVPIPSPVKKQAVEYPFWSTSQNCFQYPSGGITDKTRMN